MRHTWHWLALRWVRVAVAIVTLASSSTFASGDARGGQGASGAAPPLAMKGYDPVAYFVDGKPALGDAQHTVIHDGQQYRFRSAANRAVFAADPQKYAPQYGGYCAYGATRGYKATIDPTAFTLRDGKLYLNYSAKVQSLWEKDVPGFIKLADEKWPETRKTTKVIE